MCKQALKDGRTLIAYAYKAPGGETIVICEGRFTLHDGVVEHSEYGGNYGAVSQFVKGPRE